MAQRRLNILQEHRQRLVNRNHVVRISSTFAENRIQCVQLANWIEFYESAIEITTQHYDDNDQLRISLISLIEKFVGELKLPYRYLGFFQRTSIEKFKRQLLSVDCDYSTFLIPSGSGFEASIGFYDGTGLYGMLTTPFRKAAKDGSWHVKLKVLSGISGYTERHHANDCMTFEAIKHQTFYQYFLVSEYANVYGLRLKFDLETRFDLKSIIEQLQSVNYEDRRKAVERLNLTLPYRCHFSEDALVQTQYGSVKGLIPAYKAIKSSTKLFDSFSDEDKDRFRLFVLNKFALKNARKDKIKSVIDIFKTTKHLAVSNQHVKLTEAQVKVVDAFLERDDEINVSLADYLVDILPSDPTSPGSYFSSIHRVLARMKVDMQRLQDQTQDLQKFLMHDGVQEELEIAQEKYHFIEQLHNEFARVFREDGEVVKLNPHRVSVQRDLSNSNIVYRNFG